jgi:hypothetical protein
MKKSRKNYKWYGLIVGIIFGVVVVVNQFSPLPGIVGQILSMFNIIQYIQISETMILYPMGITLAFWAVIGLVLGWIVGKA